MNGAFLTGFMLFAALFFVGLNGVFVLAKFAFATIRGAQVERVVNESRVQIREVNEAIGSGFEAESFDNMGGLVLDLLGRPSKMGDEVWVDGHTLRVESVDDLRVERVTVREEVGGESKPREGDWRRIFLRLEGAGTDEHRAVLNKVESLLDGHPGSEVELVVVGAPAMSSRGNSLPGLLIRSGLDVAVRDNTLRVWPPRSTFKFRAFPVKRTGRSDPRRDERR